MNKSKLLWGLTGSVASKLKEKIEEYNSIFEIQFIATHSAFPFLKDTNVLSDADEWADISTVLHNLLTCCARAWDFTKPIIVAPSMNTNMWMHPATQPHIETLKSWNYTIVEPQSKKLYCGDYGMGAMANISEIFEKLLFFN